MVSIPNTPDTLQGECIFLRNGERCKMHRIYWCKGGRQLAEIGTKNVGEPDLVPRMRYIMVRLEKCDITLIQEV